MEDINYIKERFCKLKCPYNYKHASQISLGKFDYEFDCCECEETNNIEVEQVLDGLCEYCQINSFIEEIKSYGYENVTVNGKY